MVYFFLSFICHVMPNQLMVIMSFHHLVNKVKLAKVTINNLEMLMELNKHNPKFKIKGRKI